MTLIEARRITADPSESLAVRLVASHYICQAAESTLDDLISGLSIPDRSGYWRPTTLLHEQTAVQKRYDEHGWPIIDIGFWKNYLLQYSSEKPNSNT